MIVKLSLVTSWRLINNIPVMTRINELYSILYNCRNMSSISSLYNGWKQWIRIILRTSGSIWMAMMLKWPTPITDILPVHTHFITVITLRYTHYMIIRRQLCLARHRSLVLNKTLLHGLLLQVTFEILLIYICSLTDQSLPFSKLQESNSFATLIVKIILARCNV